MSTDLTLTSAPAAVAVSIVAGDDDPRAFCRRLAAAVNQGPMHLARAFQLAIQVYPVRSDTVTGTAVVMRCEFRMRRSGAAIDQAALDDLRHRLRLFNTFDERVVRTGLGPECADIAELALFPNVA